MNEQLCLFDNFYIGKDELAERICNEFNRLDTCWKGSFRVERVSLCKWTGFEDPEKRLTIDITADNVHTNPFMYLKRGDRESQKIIMNIRDHSPFIDRLMNDKDLSFCPSPWTLTFFWFRFERKKISL